MDISKRRGSRTLWVDLCKEKEFIGRWVALESVRYESGNPVEGIVVDADLDLGVLVARIQAADHAAVAVLYCDDKSSGIRAGSSLVR